MNIVYIVLEDFRGLSMSSVCRHGVSSSRPCASTPHLDTLASKGVLFENAFANAPICNPSRTSTMTGRYPSVTGVLANDDSSATADTLPNLPQLLQQSARGRVVTTSPYSKVFHLPAESSTRSVQPWDRRWYNATSSQGVKAPLKAWLNGTARRVSRGPGYGHVAQNVFHHMSFRRTVGMLSALLTTSEQPFFFAAGVSGTPSIAFDGHRLPSTAFDCLRRPSIAFDDSSSLPPAAPARARAPSTAIGCVSARTRRCTSAIDGHMLPLIAARVPRSWPPPEYRAHGRRSPRIAAGTHTPLFPPLSYVQSVEPKRVELPPAGGVHGPALARKDGFQNNELTAAQQREYIGTYLAAAAYVDAQVRVATGRTSMGIARSPAWRWTERPSPSLQPHPLSLSFLSLSLMLTSCLALSRSLCWSRVWSRSLRLATSST